VPGPEHVQPTLVLLGAYLLGSIPFSYLVARGFGVADVRRVGSGNVGATNVMRSAGAPAGALAFLLDAAKGAGAAELARLFCPGSSWLPAVAGAVAVLGHVYPIWLRFRGGKGVATGAGVFLPLAPLATLLAVAVFAGVVVVSRLVSLASILAALALPLALLWLDGGPVVTGTALAVATLVILKHSSNIRRLIDGTESRTGGRQP
jgi:glycerol-3-phosphate acyltransferase PlsY